MGDFNLITPTFLFSAISLIMLAYTNRFLSYAQLVRGLKDAYDKNPNAVAKAQIENLKRRLYLTRSMQLFGIFSLLLCVLTMFLIFIGFKSVAIYVFGTALLSLIISLGLLIFELQISVRALEIHLDDMS